MSKKNPGLPNGRFLSIPHAVADTQKFRGLKSRAVRLLVDLLRQHNGYNNGDFSIAWKLMKERGWRSKETLYRARNELIEVGFVVMTRKGDKHKPSLYAVTWHRIAECLDHRTRFHKLDMAPTEQAPGTWHDDNFE